MEKLRRQAHAGLRILAFRVSKRALNRFRQIDIDSLGDPGADAWFQRYSKLANPNAPGHGFHFVRRGAGEIGVEHFFSRDVFYWLQFRAIKRWRQRRSITD